MQFKKNDIIVPRLEAMGDAPRRILKVYKRAYLWEYSDLPHCERNVFSSVNSTDPDFTLFKLSDQKTYRKCFFSRYKKIGGI